MINRKQQPKFKTSEKLNINNIPEKKLSNGLPYYFINAGDQEVVKIDFLFNAGLIYSEIQLIADAVNDLLDAGTQSKKSFEIAEKLDFYGAYLETNIGKHFSQISLYTLNKYFVDTLSIVADLLFNSIFPQNEIDVYLKNRLQRYLITRQKTDILSQELFYKTLFGSSHPYGKQIKESDFKKLDTQVLNKFYSENYVLENMKIIIAGKVNEEHIKYLDDLFGKQKLINIPEKYLSFIPDTSKEKKKKLLVNGTLQASVKIGKKTINRNHPDFNNLNITSIILGGYFGSRLMTNIREDKGYTYGIYSSNNSLLKAGVFSISADSGKEVYQKAIDEIYKELKILRTTYVSKNELSRVKNYLIGNFAKIFDGAFTMSDTFISILAYGYNFDYYQKFFEVIKTITPDTIKNTAEKYLNEDSMVELVVGAI